MSQQQHHVLGIGNAIVDILSRVEEDFLVREDVAKGSMRLIDTNQAEDLYGKIGPATEVSGGSAANTCVGAASFGLDVAYIGKIAKDGLGDIFTHDIRAAGVTFDTPRLIDDLPTARSMILITPDGERTMNTYLGACVRLTKDDIDPDLVAGSQITYMEGYLWDPEPAKEAFRKAMTIAHEHGRKTAISLSDSFCVDRFREEFLDLIQRKQIDIVFANEPEVKSLYQTADLDTALELLKRDCELGIVTLGERGSVVLSEGAPLFSPAEKIDTIDDLTGAGDLFAAGFMTGLSRGLDHGTCARLGAIAAAEIISHVGPRPAVSLKGLAQQNGISL